MPEYRIGQELTIAIHSKFGKLITALSTAVENGEGSLGKEATSHDDLLDTFRFSMQLMVDKERSNLGNDI